MLMNSKYFPSLSVSKYLLAAAGAALFLLPAATAKAQLPTIFQQPKAGPTPIAFNFGAPIVTAGSEAPGTWYTDRFAPCLFSSMEVAPDGTRNTLEESICASNFQTPPPSFYNTQGRKYDLVANTTSVSIDLYVPSSWATTPQRAAGFWATVSNSNPNSPDFPIIEFQGPITATSPVGPSLQANGGVAGFYGWDNTTGTFTLIGLPAGFQYNSWVTLTITLVPGSHFEYTVHDARSRRGVSIQSPLGDTTDTAVANVILEGYNYNSSYNIFWNNLTFISSSFQCSTKATQPQGGGIFGLLGFLFQEQQNLLKHPW